MFFWRKYLLTRMIYWKPYRVTVIFLLIYNNILFNMIYYLIMICSSVSKYNMEHYYLFLITSTEFTSLVCCFWRFNWKYNSSHVNGFFIWVFIFTYQDNLGLLQTASYSNPSSKCTLITRLCDQSAGILDNYTVS